MVAGVRQLWLAMSTARLPDSKHFVISIFVERDTVLS